jgi:hypothetical protein
MRGIPGLVAAMLLAASASAGCASVEAAYERSERVETRGFQFDDPTIEQSFARADQLRLPARVAVYGFERNRFGTYSDGKGAQFEKALEADDAHFSEVLPIPKFLAQEGRARDVETLRRSAAKAHADTILLYEQEVEMDQSTSPLVLLNLTIVGAWVIPTVSYETRLETTAALVDVRNGVIYATLHDERRGVGTSPSALAADAAKETKARLREEAFKEMAASLKQKLDRLHRDAPGVGSAP